MHADTRDVAGTVEQVKRCVDAGAEIVRITVQGKKEAAACMAIREALFKDRCAPVPSSQTNYHLALMHVLLPRESVLDPSAHLIGIIPGAALRLLCNVRRGCGAAPSALSEHNNLVGR